MADIPSLSRGSETSHTLVLEMWCSVVGRAASYREVGVHKSEEVGSGRTDNGGVSTLSLEATSKFSNKFHVFMCMDVVSRYLCDSYGTFTLSPHFFCRLVESSYSPLRHQAILILR